MPVIVLHDENDTSGPPASAEEVATVRDNTHGWYEAGLLFFTKKRLQHIHHQLLNLQDRPGNITVEDVSGQYVERDIPIGKAHYDLVGDYFGKDTKANVIGGFIAYKSLWKLWEPDACNLSLAYQNIQVFLKFGPLRNKDAEELVMPEKHYHSHEETEKRFQAVSQEWKASQQCQKLETLLMSKPALAINKVVAFACASMADQNNDDDRPMRSRYQHALVVTLCKMFGQINESKGPIQCYAQDPAYGDVDRSVLAQHDVTVVEDPVAFLQVDDNTAVVSIAPDICVKEIVCDLAKPAVLIWYVVDSEGSKDTTDPATPRVCKLMEEHYDCHAFLEGLEDHFTGVMVYTRKDEQAASGAGA